jgi:hypothetical protein
MENNVKLIESLLEKSIEYGKTSLELIKLRTIDKTSEIVSSLIPHSIVFVLFASFMIFLNLGLAFWLGEILNKTFYGFFLVSAFYGLIGIVLRFFMYKWIKNKIRNYLINQALK